tara:strand:- start:79 stop:504 length:426 start_codon:yes stop_codon:yes gene_type:complete
MPTYNTKIFNRIIDIKYEKKDKDNLMLLIENLNIRLNKYESLIGKVNDYNIIILTALEIEDELRELKKIISENKIIQKKLEDKDYQIKKFSSEIVHLKDRLYKAELELQEKNKNEITIENEIDQINNLIKNLNQKMLSIYE